MDYVRAKIHQPYNHKFEQQIMTRIRLIWVKRPMSAVSIFRPKNPISDSDVSLFTRIRMQR